MLIKVCFKFHCNATNNKDVIRIVYELPNLPAYNDRFSHEAAHFEPGRGPSCGLINCTVTHIGRVTISKKGLYF